MERDLTFVETATIIILIVAFGWLFYRLIKDIPDIIRKIKQEQNNE